MEDWERQVKRKVNGGLGKTGEGEGKWRIGKDR